MISKNRRKWVSKLQQKKYREQEGLFLAEGEKIIQELFEGGCEIRECWIHSPGNGPELAELISERHTFLMPVLERCFLVDFADIKAVSQMNQPQGLLAVFQQPKPLAPADKEWIVAVDRVQDPGNLGTLIRSCDWFGIRHLLASEGTVDTFNFKVVQSSMGALSRVSVHRVDLPGYFKHSELEVWGTFTEGKSIYETEFSDSGILLLGNESQGIHPDYLPFISGRLHIPSFRKPTVESLNVGVSAAVILAEIRRSTV